VHLIVCAASALVIAGKSGDGWPQAVCDLTNFMHCHRNTAISELSALSP
jgi:hypothetical protein